MQYILLGAAIMLEIFATTLLKYSEGFTKIFPTAVSIMLYVLCYYFFSKALEKINLGIAYATWCGIGIVATAITSAVLFKQNLTLSGGIGIILIISGCVILNLFGAAN